MSYDVIIVGCGIAGLTCGIHLAKQKKKVCILEKYGYTGGRVVTYKKDGRQWENGAGRIAHSHRHVHGLLRKYGLHTAPISPEQLYITGGGGTLEPNTFEQKLAVLLDLTKHLSPYILATRTLEQILHDILGKEKAIEFFHQFPYRAEVSVMRADHAIQQFTGEGEMASYEGYSVCIEGLSSLIHAMVKEFESLGGVVLTRHEMIDLQQESRTNCIVVCKAGSKQDGFQKVHVQAPRVILALHSAALKECAATRQFKVLKHLVMCPLLRTYGVFPVVRGKSWFSDLSRVVTGDAVRYFIPINPSKGVAMVSYTDADDAARMMRFMDTKGEKALGQFILRHLRSLFPDREIPDMLFFKSHPWTHGCTYWKPGQYSITKLSEEAMRPDPKRFPSVYMCGESFSLRQAWMEGAIEHANAMLEKYF